jgi:hypothetical protein
MSVPGRGNTAEREKKAKLINNQEFMAGRGCNCFTARCDSERMPEKCAAGDVVLGERWRLGQSWWKE